MRVKSNNIRRCLRVTLDNHAGKCPKCAKCTKILWALLHNAASTVLIAASYRFCVVSRLLALHKSRSMQACPERIEWLVEDQAFSASYALGFFPNGPSPLPSACCLSFSVFLCVAGRAYCRGGWSRSQIIRRRASLVLYNHSIFSVSGPVSPHNAYRTGYSILAVGRSLVQYFTNNLPNQTEMFYFPSHSASILPS
jgi:hypothetical protein